MYDKGTKYGLNNPSARVESILVSLPLTGQFAENSTPRGCSTHCRWVRYLVRYEYNYSPPAGSEEARMQQVVENPRDWAAAS